MKGNMINIKHNYILRSKKRHTENIRKEYIKVMESFYHLLSHYIFK